MIFLHKIFLVDLLSVHTLLTIVGAGAGVVELWLAVEGTGVARVRVGIAFAGVTEDCCTNSIALTCMAAKASSE
jgi:hypothetical protein